MAAAAAPSGFSASSMPSLPPPCPKSPPQYPDLYGKRRETARVQMLEREIGFLEEELKSVERLQPASRCCKEIADFVAAKPDPLIPTNRKKRRSCRFWKWLCGMPCFSCSWICCCCCCCDGCSLQLEMPRCCECGQCSCNPCACCPLPKWRCCWSCPQSNCCKNTSCCKITSCCKTTSCCKNTSCSKSTSCSCSESTSCSCSKNCCIFPSCSCPECSCGNCCKWKCSCPKCPKVRRPCCCRITCCNPCSICW